MSDGGTGAGRQERLVARIREQLGAGGRMTFARFMELALYEPGLGYYRSQEDRPTAAGDFLTAPETHAIFGWTLARQVEEAWRRLGSPRPFTLLEYGAGSGSLGLAILDGLRRHRSPLLSALRYEPVELNEHRRTDLARRFEAAGLADRLARPDEPAEPIVGLVLANEFVDALPVHRVTVRQGRLQEMYVVWRSNDGARPRGEGPTGPRTAESGQAARFAEEPAEPSTAALELRLRDEGIELEEGQLAEICLALEPWLDEVARRLARGYLLVLDYGATAPELYGPRHRAGTLLAYARHRVSGDPFTAVGCQDLTAHVDFSALQRLAEARGLIPLGLVKQSEFLVAAGLADELRALQASEATTFEDYARARAGVVRMLDPRAMGRFRVLLLGRDAPPGPPSGLAVDCGGVAGTEVAIGRRPDESGVASGQRRGPR